MLPVMGLVEMPAPSPDGPRISDGFDPAVTIVSCLVWGQAFG